LATLFGELITIYSTYEPTLNFVSQLLDTHRAGTGKYSRLQVRKNGSAYQFFLTDDPGTTRDNMRLRYGELVQGYRTIPFGDGWATRVNAIGRDKTGVKVRYHSSPGTGIDESVWGRFARTEIIDGVSDGNDLIRRAKQLATAVSRLGRNLGVGLRSGYLMPKDGYDLLDRFPVDIEDGSVHTSAYGSPYWVAVGITWQALQKGDHNTTLTLHPLEDGTEPDPDLLGLEPISPQAEWQLGWTTPTEAEEPPTATHWRDSSTGIVWSRIEGEVIHVNITGTV
jgi:hypothetical protein